MSGVVAMVLRNTVDFMETENPEMDVLFQEVKKPMVIFYDADKKQVIEGFRLVAREHPEIDLMLEHKIFYTNSIPAGETGRQFGSLFYGVTYEELYADQTAE